MPFRIRLPARIVGETAAVTLGILIAFSLDTWWENRSLAQLEQVHLRALADDFERNVAALEQQIRTEESIVTGSRRMLELTASEETGSAISVDALMSDVFNSARFEPSMGAYEALVNSAGLTLIQDDALRSLLAKFATRARDRYAESWSDKHYFSFGQEFAGRIVLVFHEVEDVGDRERAFAQLLREPGFREHLALRHYSERDMLLKYRELLGLAREVLERTQAQLKD